MCQLLNSMMSPLRQNKKHKTSLIWRLNQLNSAWTDWKIRYNSCLHAAEAVNVHGIMCRAVSALHAALNVEHKKCSTIIWVVVKSQRLFHLFIYLTTTKNVTFILHPALVFWVKKNTSLSSSLNLSYIHAQNNCKTFYSGNPSVFGHNSHIPHIQNDSLIVNEKAEVLWLTQTLNAV